MSQITVTSKFLNMIRGFFPNGAAWQRVREDDSNLSKLAELIASEPQRIYQRVEDVRNEFIQSKAIGEMLIDWEENLDLPNRCERNLQLTNDERRLRILEKFTRNVVLTEDFFKNLISVFPNYSVSDVSIEKVSQTTCDKLTCDDFLRGPSSEFIIIIKIQGVQNDTLTCLVEYFQPAHMKINVVYI